MQLIAEVYDALVGIGMKNAEISDIFETWNGSELESYLIEITTLILRKKKRAHIPSTLLTTFWTRQGRREPESGPFSRALTKVLPFQPLRPR